VASYIRRKDHKKCLNQARQIYLAENRRAAVKAYNDREKRWSERYPEAIKGLGNDLDELVNFLDCLPADEKARAQCSS
jgi:transposase-like protein